MDDFVSKLHNDIELVVLKSIREGKWCSGMRDYAIKPIDKTTLQGLVSGLDRDNILNMVRADIERLIADKIMSQLATEISHDIKSILGNKPLREELRALLKAHIETHLKIVTESS